MTPRDRCPNPRTGRAPRAIVHLLTAVLLALAAMPVHAGGGVCDHCASINDTTSSGGDIASPNDMTGVALAPPIAFIGADSLLRCALPAGNAWQIETVDPTAGAHGCSIALDDARAPWIVYHANGVLYVAHKLAAGWQRLTIDATGFVSGRTAVARVPAGIAVAYHDAASGLLRYAEQLPGTGWLLEPVAQTAGGEAFPSLVVSGGVRAISYYDGEHGDLRLALGQAGTWTTEAVDTAGDVGAFSSLVGAPGMFGIAYQDRTHGALRYARSMSGGGWFAETVASGDVGRFASALAFAGNATDEVGIAYYDRAHGDLDEALRRNAAWSLIPLDQAGDTGWDASAGGTPAPNDTLGVAYSERTTGNLLYVYRANRTASVPPPAHDALLHVTWAPARDGAGGSIRFNVPAAGRVEVAIYDVTGRRLAVPLAQDLPAGAAETRWSGLDAGGRRVNSGVCFVRVATAGREGGTRAVVLE